MSTSRARGPATNFVGPIVIASAGTSPTVASPIVSNSLSACMVVSENSAATTSMFHPSPRLVQKASKGQMSSRATSARVLFMNLVWYHWAYVVPAASTSVFKLVASAATICLRATDSLAGSIPAAKWTWGMVLSTVRAAGYAPICLTNSASSVRTGISLSLRTSQL